ncbi:RAB31, member RAS oncogene family, isoform CRA_b, partial [Mus musculus]
APAGPDPEHMMAIRELKVCLLGDTGVGKSSIVCRFVQDHFDHNISPTIGASFMTKTVPCGNELHKFLIWDTAGQERFHSLAPMYYRGSAAAVIVYDITKQDSFHTLKKWVKELKEHGPENIVMAIAGNKCDLSDIRPPDPTLGPSGKWKQRRDQAWESELASQPSVLLSQGHGIQSKKEGARALFVGVQCTHKDPTRGANYLPESEQLCTLGHLLQDAEQGRFLQRNDRKLWKTHHHRNMAFSL